MRVNGEEPGSPGKLQQPPDVLRDVSRESALGNRILFTTALVLVSGLAGVALVRFPMHLHLTIGLVGAIVAASAVLVEPFFGLLLYTCMFLIRPGELYPPLDTLHLERLVGALTLAGMLLAQYRREGRILIDRSRQTALLIGFLLVVLLSVPFAYYRGAAVTGFIEMLKLVLFYLLIVHLLDSRRKLRIFVWVYGALLVYIAATAFGGYLQGSARFAQGIDRAVGGTSFAGNPNQLGTTMAVAVPLFLLLATHRPLGWRRIPLALFTLLFLATMAVTGSRASLLGFLGGVAYLCWSSRRRAALGILGVLLLGAGFVVLPDQYKTRYSTITQQEIDGSSRGRLVAWSAGMRMVMDRPVVGVGIHCFSPAHAMSYSSGERRDWLEAHSLYVQVLAELGLVGGAVFFLLLREFLRLNRRAAKLLSAAGDGWQFEGIVLKALFAGFLILLISGIFGHSLMRHTWYVYAGLGLCVWRLLQVDAGGSAAAESSG
jgi:probable O-glycosylation ligase (exosortase A-associated)